MTATLERRKEVLQLAQEHDFLILEGERFSVLKTLFRLLSIFDQPTPGVYDMSQPQPTLMEES
jgi:hypothetical protein